MSRKQAGNPNTVVKAPKAPSHAPKSPRGAIQPLVEPASAFDYTQAFALASANLNAFVGATEAWLRGITEINEELVQFANTRMGALNATAQKIAEADGAEELTKATLDHARNAADEYFAETAKVVNLTADLTRESWVPLQERWRSGLDIKPGGK